MKKKVNPAVALANDLSDTMYHLECAAGLAYCMAEGLLSGNVDDEQAGNAMVALSDYLSRLYDEQEAIRATAYNHTLESGEQTGEEEEGGATQ